MSEELLNIAKELSEKPTTELALQFMELTADNITKEKEIDRLNNIINRIDNFADRTIEIIKQQPTGNDGWILERLNGIKYLTELKENNKDV